MGLHCPSPPTHFVEKMGEPVDEEEARIRDIMKTIDDDKELNDQLDEAHDDLQLYLRNLLLRDRMKRGRGDTR